ncbi:class I SAM-dependent methyltransferase [Salisediminibacterium selenitireducens]|uniref:N-6 DNA methylase n=1 Tax=Bacillus selenitireducens (strain ATCC 700615 / DSM 15326 / MLS10) TaxID=439292 RepID=D6XSQ9_BACIE|nr:class I SAM-dependent methyltransferase [Salisediminibacterium selenitireducens]ADH98845.1 N-6 DNA methylase [[Bacillus] selenitireducens MLS10]
MESTTKTEMLYDVLDRSASLLQDELGVLYLDALSLAGDMVMNQDQAIGGMSKEASEKLKEQTDQVKPPFSFDPEEGRRAMQLAVLKGMKEATQPHHAMTPDAVTVYAGFILNKLLEHDDNKEISVMDPAAGAGNLLTGVINQQTKPVKATAFEADETLANLAFINSRIQGRDIKVRHEDTIKAEDIGQSGYVISDLPVGYYPNDSAAEGFQLKGEGNPSLIHHLLIEQSIRHTEEGGYLFFLVPDHLFLSEHAKELQAYVNEHAVIYAIMQLPETMFKAKDHRKALLLLRRKKQGIKVPAQALMAELPSFSRKEALADMTRQISEWFDQNLS